MKLLAGNFLCIHSIEMKVTASEYQELLDHFIHGYRIESRSISKKAKQLTYRDNKLYYNDRELIPLDRITACLNEIYNDPKIGLTGRDKLFERIKTMYAGILRSDIM